MAVAESRRAISAVLRMEQVEGKGRGLVASQPLKRGEIVLRESPILIYSAFPLKRRQLEEAGSRYSLYCAHCYRFMVTGEGAVTKAYLTCPSCSHSEDAIFCSSKCQSLALSSTHTPWVCQALGYLRNLPLLMDHEHQPEERQVQARYLVAAYNLAAVSPSAFEDLLSLSGDGAQEGVDSDVAVFLHSIISSFSFPKGLFPSAEMTAGLLAKEMRNSFSLMEPYLEHGGRSVRAYGIYPKASLFNHDCMPNACRFDYPDNVGDRNTEIIIRMMHDVSEGEEICISYFRLKLSYEERKKRLLNYFGFACLCKLCKAEKNKSMHDEDNNFLRTNFFEMFVCDREDCGGTLTPLPPHGGTPSDVMECNFCGYLKKPSQCSMY